MTKEDYMLLPKERLAELLAERDAQLRIDYAFIERFTLPCCAPGGICTNPQRDCINCPKQFGDVTTITTTNTFENLIEGSKGMIKEDYCSDELCELLRAKGMNKSNFTHYVQKNNKDGTSEAVTVCTLQMAMKWLRETHNIDIDIEASVGMLGVKVYVPFISTYKPLKDAPSKVRQIKREIYYKDDKGVIPALQHFDSYEEATETALKYCLTELMKGDEKGR